MRERLRDEREAAERRPAHELGAGHEDDRAPLQIVVHRRRRDPRLAGVDDQGGGLAMRGDQPVDVGERGQDQPGLGAVHDMDETVPAGGAGGGDRAAHPLGDVVGRAHPPHPVAHRNVDQLDVGAAEARYRRARRGGDAERGLVREIEAVGAVDAARADLVGAEQDGVGGARGAAGDAGERDIFEVRAGGGEHHRDLVGDAVGGADAAAQRLQPLGIDGGGGLRADPGQHRFGARISGRRDVVGGRGSVGQRSARARRAVIAVEAGGGVEAQAGVAALGHQPGRLNSLDACDHDLAPALGRD